MACPSRVIATRANRRNLEICAQGRSKGQIDPTRPIQRAPESGAQGEAQTAQRMIGGSEQPKTKEETMNSPSEQDIKPAAGYSLLWIGFYDPDRPAPNIPGDRTLTGLAFVRAEDFDLLMSEPHRFGAEPGSEVEWVEWNHPEDVPDRLIGKLLSKEELDELDRIRDRRSI